MKIKSVTIETDKGDEITMSFDEVEDFMESFRRLKKSCAPPERPREDDFPPLSSEMMRQWLAQQQLMQPVRPMAGRITTTGGCTTPTFSVGGGGTGQIGI